jgi:hypothetical protein
VKASKVWTSNHAKDHNRLDILHRLRIFVGVGNGNLYLKGIYIMKTINTYSFSELSDKAKDKALEDYRSHGFEYAWQDENMDSLKSFCDLFGVKITDYQIGTWGYSYIKTDAENSNFRGINKAKVKAIPEFLTGYCLDCDFIETFKREFERTHDAFHAFNDAIDSGLRAWIADLEDQESDDYIIESIEANEYQFLENGRII